MDTNWSKVIEVFSSGIIGVFLVMALLQILTQLSTKIIDIIENWNKSEETPQAPKPQVVPTRE